MGRAFLICAMVAVFLPLQIASAADATSDPDADDIVILAVKPRSPDVKPIAAPVSAHGQDIAVTLPARGKTQTAQAGIEVTDRR